ncbi:MAG: hypothetical protein K9J16_09330 [Melioribacteraceae bacterium]|nr:hypothetical protein [Melioribacteraceae bacterium]MCF8355993.1 hypothetical protein [Melioribacteraceae bacterium]MCF8396107.1 hypothetical protein [Melioribacteraceae bacterium]MCF8419598.1 hypothetical protein [Melioribacteraceae bacterium]
MKKKVYQDIKFHIDELTRNNSQSSLKYLVKTSHLLAITHLNCIRSRNSFLISNLGISLNDLAWDCIAEIFLRDSLDRFTVIENYFNNEIFLDSSSDMDFFIALRKLVFIHVNKNLFKIYHQIDPSLSKIIRNIKYHVNNSTSLTLFDCFNEKYIGMIINRDSNKFTVWETENFRLDFQLSRNGEVSLKEYIILLEKLLRNSELDNPRCSLIGFGMMYKEFMFSDIKEIAPSKRIEDDVIIDSSNLSGYAKNKIHKLIEKVYINKRKIGNEDADFIKKTTLAIIENYLSGIDNTQFTFFELAQKFDPDISYDKYNTKFKTKIEYLVRIMKTDIKKIYYE